MDTGWDKFRHVFLHWGREEAHFSTPKCYNVSQPEADCFLDNPNKSPNPELILHNHDQSFSSKFLLVDNHIVRNSPGGSNPHNTQHEFSQGAYFVSNMGDVESQTSEWQEDPQSETDYTLNLVPADLVQNGTCSLTRDATCDTSSNCCFQVNNKDVGISPLGTVGLIDDKFYLVNSCQKNAKISAISQLSFEDIFDNFDTLDHESYFYYHCDRSMRSLQDVSIWFEDTSDSALFWRSVASFTNALEFALVIGITGLVLAPAFEGFGFLWAAAETGLGDLVGSKFAGQAISAGIGRAIAMSAAIGFAIHDFHAYESCQTDTCRADRIGNLALDTLFLGLEAFETGQKFAEFRGKATTTQYFAKDTSFNASEIQPFLEDDGLISEADVQALKQKNEGPKICKRRITGGGFSLFDEDFTQKFQAYQDKNHFRDDGGNISFEEIKNYFYAPYDGADFAAKFANVTPSNRLYWRKIDTFLLQDADASNPISPDFLPRMAETFEYLLDQWENSGKNAFDITGELIIELRDRTTMGLAELDEDGNPIPGLSQSFDEYWFLKFRENLPFSAMHQVRVEDLSADAALEWFEQYKDWIDLFAFQGSLNEAIGQGKDVVNMFNTVSEYIEDLELDGVDVSSASFRKRKFLISWSSEHDSFLFGTNAETFANLSEQSILPPFARFRLEYKNHVNDLFNIDFSSVAAHLEPKLFLEALNINNYFHILNNGNGRIFILLNLIKSLERNWPLPQYRFSDRYNLTHEIVPSSTVYEHYKANNQCL